MYGRIDVRTGGLLELLSQLKNKPIQIKSVCTSWNIFLKLNILASNSDCSFICIIEIYFPESDIYHHFLDPETDVMDIFLICFRVQIEIA